VKPYTVVMLNRTTGHVYVLKVQASGPMTACEAGDLEHPDAMIVVCFDGFHDDLTAAWRDA
jgi:hypothetical protein